MSQAAPTRRADRINRIPAHAQNESLAFAGVKPRTGALVEADRRGIQRRPEARMAAAGPSKARLHAVAGRSSAGRDCDRGFLPDVDVEKASDRGQASDPGLQLGRHHR